MCAIYQPPRPEQFASLGLPQPTFDFKAESYPRYLSPMIVRGHDSEMELHEAMFGLILINPLKPTVLIIFNFSNQKKRASALLFFSACQLGLNPLIDFPRRPTNTVCCNFDLLWESRVVVRGELIHHFVNG